MSKKIAKPLANAAVPMVSAIGHLRAGITPAHLPYEPPSREWLDDACSLIEESWQQVMLSSPLLRRQLQQQLLDASVWLAATAVSESRTALVTAAQIEQRLPEFLVSTTPTTKAIRAALDRLGRLAPPGRPRAEKRRRRKK